MLRFTFGGGAALISIWLSMNLPVATTQTCFYMTPIVVILLLSLGEFFIGKSKTFCFRQLLYGALGLMACLLILTPSDLSEMPLKVYGMCLSYNILSSCGLLTLRWIGSKGEPPVRTTFYFSFFCLLFGISFLAFGGEFELYTDIKTNFALLFIGMLTLGMHLCRVFAWSKGTAGVNAILTYSSLPMSILLGYLIFNETITWNMLLGMVLIVAVSYLSLKESRQRNKATTPFSAKKSLETRQ